MPCQDVTEQLTVTLDQQDRVVHYSLSKLTCGGSVGNPSLLRKLVANRPAQEVLEAKPEAVLAAMPTLSETWEFLTRKHLAALQQGLSAFLGLVPSRPSDQCIVISVIGTEKGIRMEADIRVDMITSEIKACGGGTCGNCSSSSSQAH
ncbi:MAG: hypothetical protein AB1644_07630 [Candidatus Zixiibacteriota bacterium]